MKRSINKHSPEHYDLMNHDAGSPANNNDAVLLPDYDNCIVNLVASILAEFKVVPPHSPLKQLSQQPFGKNIVLLILDGFGMNLLQKYREKEVNFLAQNLVAEITTVFPSTTAAAITSFLTGKTPLEHGSIGWTMFFKEYAKYIDFLPIWDSTTHKILSVDKFKVNRILGSQSIFRQIAESNADVKQYNITLKSIAKSQNVKLSSVPAKILPHNSPGQLCRQIRKAVMKDKDKRKFIYAYSAEPDHLEHLHGVNSPEVRKHLSELNKQLSKLVEKLKGTDTTIVVTADHGLIDIEKYEYTNDDKELFDATIMPVFPEPRFISFFIKQHKVKQFQAAAQKYRNDFLIYTRAEFLKTELLGKGKIHPKIDDFIGDFIFIAKTNKALKPVYEQNGKWKQEFIAHHAGITKTEMLVPLIRIDI